MFENLFDYRRQNDRTTPCIVKALVDTEGDDEEIDVLSLLTYIQCQKSSVFALN